MNEVNDRDLVAANDEVRTACARVLARLAEPITDARLWAEYLDAAETVLDTYDAAEVIIVEGVGGCPPTAGPDTRGFITTEDNARAAWAEAAGILHWSMEQTTEAIRDRTHLLQDVAAFRETMDNQLRARPTRPGMPPLQLDHIGNRQAIQEHTLRLYDAIERDDPALAISCAKALIEATSKIVLEELGECYSDTEKVPALVRMVQKALKAHPDTIAPTAKGRATIVRLLSNLSQVADGMAELRNEYGPDHGRTRSAGGLERRHALLAAGSALSYCEFVLETLRHRSIPDVSDE
ncbi:MAG: abortive infection family protein [bacterium]|nr:abortive infection family protein [bacterium]